VQGNVLRNPYRYVRSHGAPLEREKPDEPGYKRHSPTVVKNLPHLQKLLSGWEF